VKRLGSFLGSDLTDKQVNNLVEFCSMKNMSQSPAFSYLKSPRVYDSTFSFFRKARVGDWREYFDEAMSNKVDQALRQHLKYQGMFDHGI
jgi:hypothetical protein